MSINPITKLATAGLAVGMAGGFSLVLTAPANAATTPSTSVAQVVASANRLASTSSLTAIDRVIMSRYRLDSRCMVMGRVMCVNKATRKLVYVVNKRVALTTDARFGCASTPTRNGLYHVYYKDRYHTSHEFGSYMPYAMFFDGGQAVHYSSDFAKRGYAGCSHGCVNVRNISKLSYLFSHVRVGDRVVVYRR